MRRWTPALLALWIVAGSAAGETAPSASGQRLYMRHCASCHGVEGTGNGPLREVLKTPPADLTRIAMRAGGWYPDDLVEATIDGRFVAHGTREMPVWGNVLDGEQIDLLTEYLYSLQRQDGMD